MTREISVENILKDNKKASSRNAHFIFKCPKFDIELNARVARLDGKKILSDRYEEMYQTLQGKRVCSKKVGYVNGDLTYFPAMQDEKGKWVPNVNKEPVQASEVHKVIMDLNTGLVAKKDETHGLWFSKIVPADTINSWLIEDTYNLWSEDQPDSCLKVYDYLTDSNKLAVYRFNPYGTLYNGFLYPQRVTGGHFRLLLAVARVKIDKVEIAPTMVIKDAQVRAKERERMEQIGVLAAIEEV